MKKVLIVVGTRPNFIKITQFPRAFKRYSNLEYKVIHTGQHYDEKMSDVFFWQFKIAPDVFLGIESGTPIGQMARMMTGLEKAIGDYRPDLVMVVGDVNSTAVAAVTANKMGIPIAHLESGLRSFDRTMPEEFNRIIADDIADCLFVTEQSGVDNLLREGKDKRKIFFVGNTMIDTLVAFTADIDGSDILEKLKIREKQYVLMTMHRPSNVDNREGLEKLLSLIKVLGEKYKVVFPVHPRTGKNMKTFGVYEEFLANKNFIVTDPLDYFSFQKLVKESRLVITDSGGIQEETTFLKIPCLTLRASTERPVTVTEGTNELIPFDVTVIQKKIEEIGSGRFKAGTVPRLWDGHATERVVKILSEIN